MADDGRVITYREVSEEEVETLVEKRKNNTNNKLTTAESRMILSMVGDVKAGYRAAANFIKVNDVLVEAGTNKLILPHWPSRNDASE